MHPVPQTVLPPSVKCLKIITVLNMDSCPRSILQQQSRRWWTGRSLKDWRTGRSVFGNLIPSTTGAAKAISLVIPSLKDKMNGISYRVPTSDVSIVDLNVALKSPTSYEDICRKMKEASENELSGILDYIEDEVVSSDFIAIPTPPASMQGKAFR